MRVGFVGLGNQGAPMAHRIIDAGFACALWARRPEAVAPFRGGPARIAGSLPELGQDLDLLCSCVFDAAATWEVLFGPYGAARSLRRGAAVAVHSTVAPRDVRELAEHARGRGLELIDAPVTGGAARAAEGALVTMVGADAPSWERFRPVFETFSSFVVHAGTVGAGQQVKLLNNAMFAAHVGIADDALAIGAQLGIDRSALETVLSHGSGNSTGANMVIAAEGLAAVARSRARPILGKDVRLFLDLLDGVPGGAVGEGGMLLPAARDTIGRLDRLARES